MLNNIKLLWNFLKGNRVMYLAAVIIMGISSVFAFAVPLVLRFVIDSVIGDTAYKMPVFLENIIRGFGGTSELTGRLWLSGIVIVVLTVISGLFAFYNGKWIASASEKTAKKMRENLFTHIQKLPYDYFIKAATGDLIQRCTSDVETVRRFIGVQSVEIGRALFMLILALPILFSLNSVLASVSLPVIPVILAFSIVFFTKVRKAFAASDEAEGKLSTVLQENLTGVRVVRAFGREQYELEKYDKKNIKYRDLTFRLIKLIAGYWSVSDLICMLQIGMILTMGTMLSVGGTLSIGTLVVFLTYEGMLLWPVRQMGRILADMGKALVALKRIRDILDVEIENPDKDLLLPPINGAVSFSNVSFAYSDGRKILDDISFNVKAGQTVAILGATGSGKTTLVHLLPRFYDYKEGSIKIDGVELKTINRYWIRENIGVVLQEPFMYAKTIKENIAIAKTDFSDSDIYKAAEIASVHKSITEFENGYETAVGERGVTLSGGQKQRLAIARAIITKSPIVVFDDSLSAVDTETDALIRKALLQRKNKVTTFIISHRITTLSQADLILVLDKGKLVQSGKHEELVQEEGLYKRIWLIQNSLEDELATELNRDEYNKICS